MAPTSELATVYQATRRILRAGTAHEIERILVGLVSDLGGRVVSSEDPSALPIDIAVADGDPVLIAADDPQTRRALTRYLPHVVSDARFLTHRTEGAARWAERARVDTLTGLWNRRAAQAALHRVSGGDCLALLDLDHFKRINDTFGHEAGDSVLVAFAEHLRRMLPDPVIVGRLGGEEFIAIFPQTDLDVARRQLQLVRSRWRESAPQPVTFSAGIVLVTADANGDDRSAATSAMRRADRLLYAAKRAGRDRIEDDATPARGSGGESGDDRQD